MIKFHLNCGNLEIITDTEFVDEINFYRVSGFM